MNTREEILNIASDLREGSMTTNEAKENLLRLFGVSGRSEQLCQCEYKDTKHFIKNWCDDCEKHIV